MMMTGRVCVCLLGATLTHINCRYAQWAGAYSLEQQKHHTRCHNQQQKQHLQILEND